MDKKNHYEVLNVSKSASDQDIKAAYRKLAMKYHPDRNPNDKNAEQKFKEINAAYEILGDKEKRNMYDQYGDSAFQQGGGYEQNDYSYSTNLNDLFSDLFGEFVGGSGRSNPAKERRGSDLRYNIEIELKEAFKGMKRNISFVTLSECKSCNKTGSISKSPPTTCNGCNGTGVNRRQRGFTLIQENCKQCNGQGSVVKDPCKECKGEGRVNREKTLSIDIPAGIRAGKEVRKAGEGEAGFRAGPSGDLYIRVIIKKDNFFEVAGDDLRCVIPVKFTTAILGGSLEIPSIDGIPAKITIAPGTQNGLVFRLKNKGMTILHSKDRGYLYVTLNIETPINLNKRQKELLEEFDKESQKDNNPSSESFFDKVKNIWGSEG